MTKMTLDEVCGDSEIVWRDAPQIKKETGMSMDYSNALIVCGTYLISPKETGGYVALIGYLKEHPIPGYEQYFKAIEERWSKELKQKVKLKGVVTRKNRKGVRRINEIVKELNAIPSWPDALYGGVEKSFRKLLFEAYQTIYGERVPESVSRIYKI